MFVISMYALYVLYDFLLTLTQMVYLLCPRGIGKGASMNRNKAEIRSLHFRSLILYLVKINILEGNNA